MGGLNVKANEVILDEEVHKLAEYVTFAIGSETYGVEVLKVQEIIGMTQITHVPNSMDFMKGVINLRGSVVPVVDMRIKFKMDEREYDNFTVILIVEVQEQLIGLIVDSVSDVVGIPVEGLQETPHFSANIETDYIKGIGNKDNQLIIILDVDLILSSEELERMERERISS
jgi:purine-binding chemotaxis protein CheW